MGLFSKKDKEKAKDYVRLLQSIGIDFYSLTHDNADQLELTVDDEVNGIIKKSYKELRNNYFDFVLLSDKKDGSRNVVLSKNNSTEKDLKNLIDKFYELFGYDSVFNMEFCQRDLNVIRGYDSDFKADDNLREWNTYYSDGKTYITSISYDLKSQTIFLLIFSRQTWAYENDRPKVSLK